VCIVAATICTKTSQYEPAGKQQKNSQYKGICAWAWASGMAMISASARFTACVWLGSSTPPYSGPETEMKASVSVAG
jgi:hypothetical protein